MSSRRRPLSFEGDEKDSHFGNFGGNISSSGSSESREDGGNTEAAASVTNEEERQVLLLMLLAQVCALHDPTPRTFTVHVLELFERGILDRASIQFLWSMGLVPALPSPGAATRQLLTNGSEKAEAPQHTNAACSTDESIVLASESTTTTTELALASSSTAATKTTRALHVNTTSYKSIETLRSIEATAIRRQLSRNDLPMDKERKSSHEGHHDTINDDSIATWNVENFPLSLSRYQREFNQIKLLDSGAFGSVFHAIRKLDGCDYAIKRITFDSIGYSNEDIQRVVREVQCLALVSEHPNIVRYYNSWLEPSWMTGGNSPSPGSGKHQKQLKQLEFDARNNASPQKLLKDIEQLLDSDGREDDDDSSWGSSSSQSFSSSSDSDNDTSLLSLNHRRRRSSWDSSVKSIDGTVSKAMRNPEIPPWDSANDDSLLSAKRGNRRSRSGRKPKVSTPKQYKYQVTLYIQMQLCHPATLQDWIRERNRQIPESDHEIRIGPALEIFHQLCSGLAHIHDKNIVHRDLKPANAFVSKDGKEIKIGDFGLSKQLDEIASQGLPRETNNPAHFYSGGKKKATRQSPKQQDDDVAGPSLREDFPEGSKKVETAIVPTISALSNNAIVGYRRHITNEALTAGIGTASYAAPEQVKSKKYGTAADIFSLGLIFLELVCCFETEHERLHNFQQCRNQRIPQWLEEQYPHIASTVLACTKANACDRPTAKDLLDHSKPMSPRVHLEINVLKGQLLEKDKLLAKKDKEIDDLRAEVARMKNVSASTVQSPSCGKECNNNAVCEKAVTVPDDDSC